MGNTRWGRALAATLAVSMLGIATAQAQFGFGRDRTAPESLLADVRAGDYAEDCAEAQERIAESALEQGPDSFDLIAMLAGSPPAAALGVRMADNPADQAYINELLNEIMAIEGPPEGIIPKIWVDASQEIDARQRGVGDIYISKGLMDFLVTRELSASATGESEARMRRTDLMFVVAHEYAHVLMCHYNRAAQVSENRRMMGAVATVGITAVVAGNLELNDLGNNTYEIAMASGNRMRDGIFYALAGYTVLQTFNSGLLNPAWSREQERNADWLAVELMRHAGYDTSRVPDLLEQLKAQEVTFQTHMEEVLGSLPARALNAAALTMAMESDDQGSSFLTTLGIDLGVDMIRRWRERASGHFHDDPERRSERIGRMIVALDEADAAFAATEEGSEPVQVAGGFQRIALAQDPEARERYIEDQDARLRREREVYDQVYTLALSAHQKLADEDLEGGCADAAAALALDPDSPMSLEAQAYCEVGRNDFASAGRVMDHLVAQPTSTLQHYILAGQIWRDGAQPQLALAVFDRGEARFGREPFFLPRLQTLQVLNDVEAAQTVARDCSSLAQDIALKTQCAGWSVALSSGSFPAASPPATASSEPQETAEGATGPDAIGQSLRDAGSALGGLFRRGSGSRNEEPAEPEPSPPTPRP